MKTIAAYGNETKWLREIREWWKIAQNDKALQGITHATQKAGKYPLVWDGTDQQGNGVANGTYTIWIQVGSEHGANVAKSAKITCGPTPATATIPANGAFLETKIKYGPTEEQ